MLRASALVRSTVELSSGVEEWVRSAAAEKRERRRGLEASVAVALQGVDGPDGSQGAEGSCLAGKRRS